MFPHEYRRALQEQAESENESQTLSSKSSKSSKSVTPVTPPPALNGVNEIPATSNKLEPVQNDLGARSESSSSLGSVGSDIGISSESEKEDFVEDNINPLTDVGSTQIKVVSERALIA